MSKIALLIASMFVAAGASAANVAEMVAHATQAMVVQMAVHPMARFNVGDVANYNLTVSSMQGTMVMTVTAATATAVTIDQKVDLGAMGQQDEVEVIDPTTGQVTSITVNGQPQTPPDPNDQQITSQQLATITVPAGTFKCQDIKVHMKSENTDAEMWADMDDVPVGGMLKMTTTEQGMPVEADLTSFTKAP